MPRPNLRYAYKGGGSDALADFGMDLSIFSETVVPRKHVTMQRKIVTKFFRLVAYANMEMLRHPIDTGWAQRNWRISVNSVGHGVLGSRKDKQQKPRTIPQINAQMDGIKPYQKIYVFNNVPYMGELENGTSQMAPVGIVRPALMEIEYFISTL